MTQNPYEPPTIARTSDSQEKPLELPMIVSGNLTAAEFQSAVRMNSLARRWQVPFYLIALVLMAWVVFRVSSSTTLPNVPGIQGSSRGRLYLTVTAITPFVSGICVILYAYYRIRKSLARLEPAIHGDRTLQFTADGFVQSMNGSDYECEWQAVESFQVRAKIAVIKLKPQPSPGLVFVAMRWFPNLHAWEQTCRWIESKIGSNNESVK